MFFLYLLLIYLILATGACIFWRRQWPGMFHLFLWPGLLATIVLALLNWAAIEDHKRHNTPQAIFQSEFHQQSPANISYGEWTPGADDLFIALDFQCTPNELRSLLSKMHMHQISMDEFQAQAAPADAKVNYTATDKFFYNDNPLPSHSRAYNSEKRFIIYNPTQHLAQYRFSGID